MARFYEREITGKDGKRETELRIEIIFGSEEFSSLKKPDAADRVATGADKIKYVSALNQFEADKTDKAIADAAIAKERAARTKREAAKDAAKKKAKPKKPAPKKAAKPKAKPAPKKPAKKAA